MKNTNCILFSVRGEYYQDGTRHKIFLHKWITKKMNRQVSLYAFIPKQRHFLQEHLKYILIYVN